MCSERGLHGMAERYLKVTWSDCAALAPAVLMQAINVHNIWNVLHLYMI